MLMRHYLTFLANWTCFCHWHLLTLSWYLFNCPSKYCIAVWYTSTRLDGTMHNLNGWQDIAVNIQIARITVTHPYKHTHPHPHKRAHRRTNAHTPIQQLNALFFFTITKTKPWRFYLSLYIHHAKMFSTGSIYQEQRSLNYKQACSKEMSCSAFFTSGNLSHLSLLGKWVCGWNISLRPHLKIPVSQKKCKYSCVIPKCRHISLGELYHFACSS